MGLICKLVTHGPDRESAALAMEREVFEIPDFKEGKLTTNFIPDHFPEGFFGHELTDGQKHELLAAAVAIKFNQASRKASIDPAQQMSTFQPAAIVIGEPGFDLAGMDDDALLAAH